MFHALVLFAAVTAVDLPEALRLTHEGSTHTIRDWRTLALHIRRYEKSHLLRQSRYRFLSAQTVRGKFAAVAIDSAFDDFSIDVDYVGQLIEINVTRKEPRKAHARRCCEQRWGWAALRDRT